MNREPSDYDDDTVVIESAGALDETGVIRSEDELRVETVSREAGTVGVRKIVESNRTDTVVPVGTEYADMERQTAVEGDSGEVEILPDGSVSIPVFEEELVIEKRLVVRERVIVRKRTELEEHLVEADLRRERLELDADEGVEVHDDDALER